MGLREAAKMALEALVDARVRPAHKQDFGKYDAAITALRAALAEPQTTHWEGCEEVHPECRKPEPVAAWENKYGMKEWEVHAIRAGWMPAPTPRKPLTKEQIMSIDVLRYHFALNGGAGPISKKGKEIIEAIEAAHGIGEQHE